MTGIPAVLFEDEHCLAVAKPPDLPTQGRAAGEASLEAMLRRYLRPDDPGAAYLGTVHRLDRPVSGVILWAKTTKAARRLAGQFARREAIKEYWAVVSGSGLLDAEQGLWDDWLGPVDPGRGVATIGRADDPGARRALTRYRIGRDGRWPAGCRWLRLRPETGRTHQLRAQAAARGLPILGDLAYGSPETFPAGIALHARSLTVRHPTLGRPLTLVAPPPASWSARGIVPPDDPGPPPK